jgi:hypothetical protein
MQTYACMWVLDPFFLESKLQQRNAQVSKYREIRDWLVNLILIVRRVAKFGVNLHRRRETKTGSFARILHYLQLLPSKWLSSIWNNKILERL